MSSPKWLLPRSLGGSQMHKWIWPRLFQITSSVLELGACELLYSALKDQNPCFPQPSGSPIHRSQAPPSMGFFRQEYWSGLPFPSPGDLPDPGIEPLSSVLQADSLPSEPPGKSPYISPSETSLFRAASLGWESDCSLDPLLLGIVVV